jgi:hypothetical protein
MDVVDIARREVGVTEEPPNSNKVKYNTWIYGKEVSGSAYPWCGAFVSFCFDQAGRTIKGAGLSKGFVGCPYAVEKVSKWGKIVTVPQPGDVVFFDWDGNGIFDHTGIFEKDLGKGLFQAIEGNTAFGNDSNGGAVMVRADRKYKNAIFVRPNT